MKFTLQKTFLRATVICAVVLFEGGALAAGPSGRVPSKLRETILTVLAEKQGSSSVEGLRFGPLYLSQNPAYFELVVDRPLGSGTVKEVISVARNGRFLAAGKFYALNTGTDIEISNVARKALKLNATDEIAVGRPESS